SARRCTRSSSPHTRASAGRACAFSSLPPGCSRTCAGSRTPTRSRAFAVFASTASPVTSSGRCVARPTVPVRSSPPATRARTRSPPRTAPRRSSASSRGGRRRSRELAHVNVKRVAATLVVTGLCTAYIFWKIDFGTTGHVLAHASVGWWLLSLAIMAGSVWPMAWRWQRLLEAREVHDRLRWLVRAYFVGYAAGQVLPTSLGGDASRIYETMRRHEGAGGAAAGTVLLERALGGVATLLLAAVGFALAVGRYDVGGYLWVELAFV